MRNIFTNAVRSSSNTRKSLGKVVATLLAKMSRTGGHEEQSNPMIERHRGGMSLHSSRGRKYLNASERRRFLTTLGNATPKVRLFCLTLMWSGCRISEALAITPVAIDLDGGYVSLNTLKKRAQGVVRQVPLPPTLISELDSVFNMRARQRDPEGGFRRLWPWSRSTGWRHVKNIMKAADISGSAAMPKGLRHAFGVAAFEAVPPHIVQRWLGHASLRTTAIYGEVSGQEERNYATRIWQSW